MICLNTECDNHDKTKNNHCSAVAVRLMNCNKATTDKQTHCAPLNLLVEPGGIRTYLWVLALFIGGIVSAKLGGITGPLLVVVILFDMFWAETTKKLVRTQREYIATLEEALRTHN